VAARSCQTLGLAEDTLARAGTLMRSRSRGPVYAGDMKVAEILRLLHQEGWLLVAQRGSHRQFKHESKPGRVTVPGKPSDDLAPGTQNSILKQAGLK
jgi:predicted RNA binding protein YcfA (HicA-like mRNA interferase family)